MAVDAEWRKALGTVLRQRRNAATAISLRDFADVLGVSHTYLSRVEVGHQAASARVVAAYERQLGLATGSIEQAARLMLARGHPITALVRLVVAIDPFDEPVVYLRINVEALRASDDVRLAFVGLDHSATAVTFRGPSQAELAWEYQYEQVPVNPGSVRIDALAVLIIRDTFRAGERTVYEVGLRAWEPVNRLYLRPMAGYQLAEVEFTADFRGYEGIADEPLMRLWDWTYVEARRDLDPSLPVPAPTARSVTLPFSVSQLEENRLYGVEWRSK